MEKNVFYVHDYLETGKTDSEAIENCFMKTKACKSRTVVFDKKTWRINKAVLISSNTEIVIDNCEIVQDDCVFDNMFRGENVVLNPEDPYGLPIECKPISNIKIIGKGKAVLSGPEKNAVGFHTVLQEEQEMVGDFWGFRTHQISLSNCDGFEISGLSVVKTRGWAMSFDLCQNGYVHDIYFYSDVKNGDGIDFRSGCRQCTVENISGYTSDDTVACTALYKEDNNMYPRKNYLYPGEPARCINRVSQAEKDVSDIVIRNVFTAGRHHGIICLAANGCRVYNILIENVKEPPGEWRQSTVKIYTGYGDGYSAGDLHDIHVRNVEGNYADNTVYCNAEVKNVILENISHKEPEKTFKLDFPQGIEIRGV